MNDNPTAQTGPIQDLIVDFTLLYVWIFGN